MRTCQDPEQVPGHHELLGAAALERVAGGLGGDHYEMHPPSSQDAWAPGNLLEISGPPQRIEWLAVDM